MAEKATTRATHATNGVTDPNSKRTIYAAFWLYQTQPDFFRLSHAEQAKGKREFLAALEGRHASVTLRGAYSLVGLRNNADLMLWLWGEELNDIQRLAVALRQSGLGRYLTQTEAYLGVTAAPRYDPEHGPAFTSGVAPKQYVSVYPFVKTTEWFLLPYEERRSLMAEHGRVGRHYAVPRARLLAATAPERNGHGNAGKSSATATTTRTLSQTTPTAAVTVEADEEGGGVLSNTVDAFALGDYEFILANESDDPDELCRMMMSLRATEVRRYTKLDTPIYLGRLKSPEDALADL